MYLLQSVGIECPYCAEAIEIVVDTSIEQQQYVEDCSVCCRPLHMTIQVSDSGDIQVQAVDEDAC
jgi:hypothetical protein